MRVVIHFKLIRDAILKSGLSETEWAKRYGFSQRAVNSWVKEERAPRFKNILKLAQALDCSVSDICPNLPCEEFREAVIKTGDHSMLQAAYENKTYPKEFLDQVSQEMNIKITVNEQGANMTKLAFYRRKAGLTQESLGEKLGVSKQLISAWENFAAVIDPKHVDKLKSALDLSEAEIIDIVADAQCGTRGLAYYRKRKGISQEEMGEYLSVPKANISAWENGTRGIPLKHFDKIARMLDLTEAELQEIIAHCREEERTVAVPEIVGELAQKIYDKAYERAKLRQESLRKKFMGQLKQTYAGFTEEEYQEILYSLIKDEISPILIRGEISRMTSSIAFLAHAAEQGK